MLIRRRQHPIRETLLLCAIITLSLSVPNPLRAQGRISRDSAAVVARSRVPGGEIRSAEYEQEDGRWVWSFDLEVAGRSGIQEVLVDASTGEVVALQHESAAAEAGEAKAEKERGEVGEESGAGETAEAGDEAEAEDAAEREEGGLLQEGYRRDFDLSSCALTTSGRSDYMILEPGYRLVLEGSEGGEKVRLQITVLQDTVVVDGQPTRVVEEREWHGGRLAEVSRNFMAICPFTDDVFYFGEEVDVFRGGEVVGHEGAWRAGRDGARAGLLMPGHPEVGQGYYQEVAPGVAMDRARVVSTRTTVETPAGDFHGCLKTYETTPLEPNASEYKYYAPGVGLLIDESLRLVRYGTGEGG